MTFQSPGPMAPRVTITQDTIDLIRAAQADVTRAGITTQSGLQGYELEAPAKVIVPIITPLVNMMPRRGGSGNPVVHWKAIVSFDTQRSVGVLTEGNLPSMVAYQETDMQNPYKTLALMNQVSFDAQWTGRSLEGDVRARRVGELLYQLKTREELWLLNACQFLLPPAKPILATATTGGTVAANTYWVQITAVNGNGESTPSAAASIVTTGATSTITVTLFTVPFASYYNVYIGSGASQPANGAMWLQAGLSGAGNAAQPGYNVAVALYNAGNPGPSTFSAEAQGPLVTPPLLSAPPATSGTNPPTVNGAKSFVDPNTGAIQMFDGIIAQAINNATQANGATLGAQVATPTTTDYTLALTDLQNLLMNIYNQAAGDPDYLVMHPIQSNKLTNLTIAAGQTRYVIEANQPDGQGKLVAQYRVTHFLNQATGKEIPIIVDRYCPVDSIVALPMSIPYPVNDVANAIEIETNQEYWGIDYAITDSSYKFGDYVNEACKVYFLGGLGVLRGIRPAI